jgi:hypothetical protein
MPRKRATSTYSPSSTQFIEISNPTDKSWHRTVRSHAARRYYIKARQCHAQQHEMTRVVDEDGMHRGPREPQASASDNHLVRISQTKADLANYDARVCVDPALLFSIRSVDPFNTLVRPTTRFEGYLLHHCASAPTCPANHGIFYSLLGLSLSRYKLCRDQRQRMRCRNQQRI